MDADVFLTKIALLYFCTGELKKIIPNLSILEGYEISWKVKELQQKTLFHWIEFSLIIIGQATNIQGTVN